MTNQQQQKPQPKKYYKQPKLKTFGDLRGLTQSGSNGQNENPAMVGDNFKP